ncbi:MAG: NAD(P)/FAD-dependent oxidoreductase [Planctomycetaceae bacterium]
MRLCRYVKHQFRRRATPWGRSLSVRREQVVSLKVQSEVQGSAYPIRALGSHRLDRLMKKRIAIIGGGFAGLAVAQGLRKTDADVTLIDKRNHHLFQPLLYQVATGQLSSSNIARPLRELLKRNKNTEVLMAKVSGFDVKGKQVLLTDGDPVPYDILVIAAGSQSFYFNNDKYEKLSTGLKSLDDAAKIRERLVRSFEEAERQAKQGASKELIQGMLTFVVVGGGPTGLETAGAIAEASHETLRNEFRHINPEHVKVVLVEGQDRVLPPFHKDLSAKAEQYLKDFNVDVRTGWMMADMSDHSVTIKRGDEEKVIYTRDVIWSAGVKASPLGLGIAEATGAETDRGGRVHVGADFSIKGYPDIFVLGDLAHYEDAKQGMLPGTGAVAVQEGKYLGKELARRIAGQEPKNFSYWNKGSMAVIGRNKAVADLGFIRLGGFFAWQTWLYVHLLLMMGYQNRALVWMKWCANFFTGSRPARIVTIEDGSGMTELSVGKSANEQ